MFDIKENLRRFAEFYEGYMGKISTWGNIYILVGAILMMIICSFAGSILRKNNKGAYADRFEMTFMSIFFAIIVEVITRNVNSVVAVIHRNNILYIGNIYELLNQITTPYTDYILLLFPFYILVFSALVPFKLASWASFLIGVWVVISFLFFLRHIIVVFFANPLSGAFVLVTLVWLRMFSSDGIKGNYSGSSIFSGLSLRSKGNKFDGRTSLVKQIAFLGMLSAFYLNITISSATQLAYYMAMLAGLLAIIGFLALIFTFTFEMMNSHNVRKTIASDTKEAQGRIMVLISITIAGVFVSESPLTFDFKSLTIQNFIPLCIFTFCMIGGGAALDFTVQFFHKIVDFVTGNNLSSEADLTFAFLEMQTSEAYSSVSDSHGGFSRMRSHLEEIGDKVLTVSGTNSVAIRRMKKTVIIIPKTESPISKSDAELYASFVKRGNGILIMVDQADASHKKDLLSVFGIEARPFSGEVANVPIKYLDLKGDLAIENIGDLKPVLQNPIALKFSQVTVSHFASNGEYVPGSENNSILFCEFGRGLAIVVGSIDHWANQHINEGEGVLFLDYVRAIFKEALSVAPTTTPIESVKPV